MTIDPAQRRGFLFTFDPMTTRFLTPEDYETLVEWWNGNKFTPPPKAMLPQNGEGGLIVTTSDNVCAGFLYTTNSRCAWVEWIVANPEYREKDRASAILHLIESLKELARELGFQYIYTTVKSRPLIEKYEKCGFLRGDSNSQEMVIKLWE